LLHDFCEFRLRDSRHRNPDAIHPARRRSAGHRQLVGIEELRDRGCGRLRREPDHGVAAGRRRQGRWRGRCLIAGLAVVEQHAGDDAGLQQQGQNRGRGGKRQRARCQARDEIGKTSGQIKAARRLTHRLCIDLLEQRIHRAGGWRAERFVDADCFEHLFANKVVAARQARIAR
jgi:hypothetical protein